MHFNKKKNENKAAESMGCSQGFLEQLTGIRLPPLVGIGANLAIFTCHIDHHPHVFIPLIGLNFGYKVGQLLVDYLPKVSPNPELPISKVSKFQSDSYSKQDHVLIVCALK